MGRKSCLFSRFVDKLSKTEKKNNHTGGETTANPIFNKDIQILFF